MNHCTTTHNVADLTQALQQLRDRADQLNNRARGLENEAQVVRNVRAGILEAIAAIEATAIVATVEETAGESPPAQEPEQEPLKEPSVGHAIAPESPLAGLDIAFAYGTRQTVKEKVFIIAEAVGAGAILNTTEVANYLMASGHRSESMRSLRPNVHRIFDEHDEFEKISAGNWRVVGLDMGVVSDEAEA